VVAVAALVACSPDSKPDVDRATSSASMGSSPAPSSAPLASAAAPATATASAAPTSSAIATKPLGDGPCKPFGANMKRASDFGHEHATLYVPKDAASVPPKLSWRKCSAGLDECEELDTSPWAKSAEDRNRLSMPVLDTGVDESPRLVASVNLTENGFPCASGFVTVLPSGDVASAALFKGHIEMLQMSTYEGFISFSMSVSENANPDNPGDRANAVFTGYNAAAPPFLGELGVDRDVSLSSLVATRGTLLRSGGKPSPIDFTQDIDFAGTHVVMHVRNLLSVAAADGVFATVADVGDAKILDFQANSKFIVWVEQREHAIVLRGSPFATTADAMKAVDLLRMPEGSAPTALRLGGGNALFGGKVFRLRDGARWSLSKLEQRPGVPPTVIGVTDQHLYFERDAGVARVPLTALGEPDPLPSDAPPEPASSAGPATSAGPAPSASP
jgi:hypothetical protein